MIHLSVVFSGILKFSLKYECKVKYLNNDTKVLKLVPKYKMS